MPECVALSKELQNRIDGLKTVIRERSGDSLNEWLSVYAAAVHPLQPHHLNQVAASYFAGNPPFSSRKSRADLPDALIWESILDILKTHRPLHVVTGDKRLRSCAKGQEGILAYESLAAFIAHGSCRKALQELDEENVFNNSMRAVGALVEFEEAWFEEVKEMARVVIGGSTFRDEEVPTDDHEAQIVEVIEVSQFDLELKDAEYYGVGEIEIPLKVIAACKVQYKLPICTYEELSMGRAERLNVSELDPFTYSIEEEAELMVLGFVAMQLDVAELKKPNSPPEDLLANVRYSQMKVRLTDVFALDWY